MEFEKCAIMTGVRRSGHNYFIRHEIAIKEHHVYLDVEIDSNLKWSSNIQTISNKSTKALIS